MLCRTVGCKARLDEPEFGMDLKDDEAIHTIVRQWATAWNCGNMAAAAELFCDDADFVNVAGSHWHGRQQIEAEHAQLHRSHLKGSVCSQLTVGVQHIAQNTALVHIRRLMTGDHNPDGTPRKPRQGVMSWVMLRDTAGRWLIRSAHNTDVRDSAVTEASNAH